MSRIKLDIPGPLPFETTLKVRVTDLNYGGHLGNDAVLSLMHEARYQYFMHYGYTEMNAEGCGFLMGDCAIVYKSEGFYGQEILAQVGAGDYTRVAFDLYYRLLEKNTGKEMALAKTGLIAYDFDAKKVISTPAALKARLGSVDPQPQIRC